jgi:hypothetical protein
MPPDYTQIPIAFSRGCVSREATFLRGSSHSRRLGSKGISDARPIFPGLFSWLRGIGFWGSSKKSSNRRHQPPQKTPEITTENDDSRNPSPGRVGITRPRSTDRKKRGCGSPVGRRISTPRTRPVSPHRCRHADPASSTGSGRRYSSLEKLLRFLSCRPHVHLRRRCAISAYEPAAAVQPLRSGVRR